MPTNAESVSRPASARRNLPRSRRHTTANRFPMAKGPGRYNRSLMLTRLAALLCVAVLSAIAPVRGTVPRPLTPILVELFTSEGCSSCPPADAFLQRLIDAQPIPDVQVIGIGHHVTYWDHQGWRDRFSSETLTDRQRQYGSALHVADIFTPQMIVDGRSQFVGSDAKAGVKAIEEAASRPHGTMVIVLEPAAVGRVAVSLTAAGLPSLSRSNRADMVVAVTEDGLTSNVRAGENSGRTLAHAAVVRRLTTVGEALGEQASARTEVALDREWRRERLKIVAFVQERSSRRVLGAGVAVLR